MNPEIASILGVGVGLMLFIHREVGGLKERMARVEGMLEVIVRGRDDS